MPRPVPMTSALKGDSASLREDSPLLLAIPDTIDRLSVKGTDTFRFLQGQVTCDMTEVEQGSLRLGTHCNPKGRAQASFIVCRSSEGCCLFLPAGMLEPTLLQLQRYAAFSKVSLQAGGDMRLVAVAGTAASAWLESVGIDAAARQPLSSQVLPGSHGTVLLAVHQDDVQTLLDHAPEGSLLGADQAFWQLLTLAGQAHVFPSTQEQFIPQELNHDLCGGISFRKGCYKGQEIIARLHFRGTPKYRTRLFLGKGMPPAAGDACHGAGGQKVGSVAQSIAAGAEHCLVLAVIHQDVTESELLTVTGTPREPAVPEGPDCHLAPIAGGCAIPPSPA